nr:MAG TPA: Pre-mRNA-splicing factor 8, U4/U6 small, assembly, pre-B complex, U1 [Caudoviricetes sp.]
MSSHSKNIALSIYGLSEGDEEFKTKFKQLLNETKQRLQKEFDEL